jgi:hypothetical protein
MCLVYPADIADVGMRQSTRSYLQTPIFGAGFSTTGGFAGFSGAAADSSTVHGDHGDNPEEECKAEFTPLVQLEEVEKNTGEEHEDCLLEMYAFSFSLRH